MISDDELLAEMEAVVAANDRLGKIICDAVKGRDEIIDALKAELAACAAGPWQPPDTAPTGRVVLCAFRDGETFAAEWRGTWQGANMQQAESNLVAWAEIRPPKEEKA